MRNSPSILKCENFGQRSIVGAPCLESSLFLGGETEVLHLLLGV